MQQTSQLQEALIVFHKWCESKSINPKSFLSSEQTDGNDVGTRTTYSTDYSTDYSADAYNVFESFHKEPKDGLDAAKEVSKGLVQESPELDVNMSFKEVYDKKIKPQSKGN